MQNITSVAGLKNAIQLLEAEQAVKRQLLKEQFHLTYESFKPVNLLKSTLKDIASSPYLIENILGNAIYLATGYLSKKIVAGESANIVRKLISSLLKFVVTNVVAHSPDPVQSFGQIILQRIFRKKERIPS